MIPNAISMSLFVEGSHGEEGVELAKIFKFED